MLLGTTNNKDAQPVDESFIIQLMLQQRFVQAYELLINQQSMQPSLLYNTALCLHWAGKYHEALSRLESIQLAPNMSSQNKFVGDSNFKIIVSKQNQTDDYLHGITNTYIKTFPALVSDAIVRLKTDCWLQLGDYAKVITIGTPIAHKGYKNITDALQLANKDNDKRI